MVAGDPLMTLRVLSHAAANRPPRMVTDTGTVTAAVVMMGISPFFRAFGPPPTVEDHLSAQPAALAGMRKVLRRSNGEGPCASRPAPPAARSGDPRRWATDRRHERTARYPASPRPRAPSRCGSPCSAGGAPPHTKHAQRHQGVAGDHLADQVGVDVSSRSRSVSSASAAGQRRDLRGLEMRAPAPGPAAAGSEEGGRGAIHGERGCGNRVLDVGRPAALERAAAGGRRGEILRLTSASTWPSSGRTRPSSSAP